jgi:hypothetical protein
MLKLDSSFNTFWNTYVQNRRTPVATVKFIHRTVAIKTYKNTQQILITFDTVELLRWIILGVYHFSSHQTDTAAALYKKLKSNVITLHATNG